MALSLLAALLALPLTARAAREGYLTHVPNTTACKLSKLKAKHGSYENCIANTPATISVYPEIFSADSSIWTYRFIRKDFLSHPRAKGFVLAADDCEGEKGLRRKIERDIFKLKDARDDLSVMLEFTEVSQAEKDAKAVLGGKLTGERARESSKIHKVLSEYQGIEGNISDLIANMQTTEIEDECGTPEDNSGWTAVDSGTRYTPAGGATDWTSRVKGTKTAPGEEGSPYGEPGRTTESGLPTADTRCSGGRVQGQDHYGRPACICPDEYPHWDGVQCVALPEQTISCSGGATPGRDENGQLACFCPSEYPVWDGSQCVARHQPQPTTQPETQPSDDCPACDIFKKAAKGIADKSKNLAR
jgi:hypothetical protein